MTNDEIRKLLELEEKATPAILCAERQYDGARTVAIMRHQNETICVNATSAGPRPWEYAIENAELIAAAWNSIRPLTEEVIRLWQEVLRLREEVARLKRDKD